MLKNIKTARAQSRRWDEQELEARAKRLRPYPCRLKSYHPTTPRRLRVQRKFAIFAKISDYDKGRAAKKIERYRME